MLKKRVVPVLLLKEGRMVKGQNFTNYRETGLPSSTIRIYSAQDADELCFINLDQSDDGFNRLIQILSSASNECFIPLTAGGGVSKFSQISQLFNSGADKVLLTSCLADDLNLLTTASRYYGSQSIVAGIDYFITDLGPVVAVNHGRNKLDVNILDYAMSIQNAGAGEVFLNCISNDGNMDGYDLKTANIVSSALSIPTIISGGAGNYHHLKEALQLPSVSAAACASLFHFGDNNPIRARSYLRNASIPMRLYK